MAGLRADLRPIEVDDNAAVSQFLHEHLNPRVSSDAWSAIIAPPWSFVGPNHGYMLISDDAIVGVYTAVYSERAIERERVLVCNLAAFCVLEEHRPQSLRLIRALLGQKGIEFTDLSPSGNVVAMNERLGFRRLDTATRLVANLPSRAHAGITVTNDPSVIGDVLDGRDSLIYHDHRDAPAALHVVVVRENAHAYLVFRRDRRKRIPLFASPLYVGGNWAVLEQAWSSVASHLLIKHGLVATLAEKRVLGFVPHGPGRDLSSPRPKMYRGSVLDESSIDYLYSELTLVSW